MSHAVNAIAPPAQQNQLKELEALAAQKAEEVERLLRQNSELKFRHSILQKVVNMRDHQLKVMRGPGSGAFGGPGYTVPWGGANGAQQQQPAAPSCSGASGTNGGVCGGGGGGSGGAPGTPQNPAASDGCGTWAAGEAAGEVAGAGAGPDGGCKSWKNFLSDVAVPLLALETDPRDEAAAAQLAAAAAQAAYLIKGASLLAPDTLATAMQIHLESEAPGAPEPGHWLPVVRTLELSPQQEAELRAVWGLYSGVMRAVVAERGGIMATLATGVHGSTQDIVRMMSQMTVSPECEVMQTLQRNMRREKSAHLLLRGYLYGHTLTTLQFVKASVYSYPWLPDATAIVAVVAEQGAGAAAAAPGAAP
eukprot:XP_001694679.1 predicted protein [Chlamydomonas reinhardtii]